jgi:hypothetical protein
MTRLDQFILILSTILGSWLGMQAVHELGHVLGARLTGGRVERVVLHPLTISRTDLADNPRPLAVVWAGPILGITIPVVLWGMSAWFGLPGAFILRFFAGFCLLANGLYIGVGSFDRIGDCGEMLRHGSEPWQLWLFGAATAPAGLLLWHRQGPCFGLGPASGHVSRGTAYGTAGACVLLLVLGLVFGGE